MTKRMFYVLMLLALVLGLTLAGCKPADNVVTTVEPTEEPTAEPTEAPVVEPTEEPTEEPMGMDLSGVTISFWHVYGEGDPRNATIVSLVDEFNATNEYGITVEALDQGAYGDVEDKVNAGLQSGDLPNVVQAYTSALLNWDTVGAVADLAPMVADPMYGLTQEELDDIYPSVLAIGVTPDGRRLSWPLSLSANLMVYNFTWAQELGFANAPTNTAELKEQLCAAAAANAADPAKVGTGGMVWYASASNFLSFLYAFGGQELNEAGDAYDFNTAAMKDVALYINDLRDAGCTFETESYPNPEQAQRLALVTLSSNAGLPYYLAAFEDAANEDEWGFLPFLGPDGGQSADAFSQAVGVLTSTPEQDMASWLFIKYLTSAENQAEWIVASGYLPTHFSTEAMLADYIAANPIYQTALDLAALGRAEPETFPAWNSVRRAINDAAAAMYAATTPEEIDAILAQLTIDAADYVAELQ